MCDEPSYFGGSTTAGGNPVRVINLTTQQDSFGPDPNLSSPGIPVGAMHMGNAVLMHTLKPTAAWPVPTALAATDPDQFILETYDLDRVITYGGASYIGGSSSGINVTAELGASNASPSAWTWKRKADCPTAAVYGSIVVLPDGSVLRVGGQDDTDTPPAVPPIAYRFTTERFFPMKPTDVGVWQSLALRSSVSAIERGYHSVAGLLKSGAVFLCGGREDTGVLFTDPEDSAEVYKPPYFFQGTRPGLNAGHEPTLRYGVPFCVYTPSNPSLITHASLIGLCSTTHHFDYGQRYVELLVTSNLTSLDCTGPENLAILPPPKDTMAPTNYYLLFIVDDKGRPSNGVIVRLSHP